METTGKKSKKKSKEKPNIVNGYVRVMSAKEADELDKNTAPYVHLALTQDEWRAKHGYPKRN
jgi:hypothetical protein